jgi:hypothetical protein
VGGVNISTAIDKLQPIEAEQLRGFEFDEYGTIGAPRAPKNIGTISGTTKILSAHLFQRDSGATQLIVHLDDGSLRYSTDFLSTGTTASWTTIVTAMSTSAPYSFATFLNKVWMGNGTNDLRSWDGAATAIFASAPKGRFMALWRDTLWMSGEAANPHRVYQSAAGDPTVWPALNFVDIEKGVGIGVAAIFAVESALIIWKLGKTHIIFDPVEYTNRVIDNSKGCVSHFSVVAHNGLVYFVSHLGVCRFLGDGPSQLISEKIRPIFDDLYVFGSALATPIQAVAEEASIWGYSFENYVGWYIPGNSISQYIKYFPNLPDQPWVFGSPMDLTTLTGRACLISVRDPANVEYLFKIANVGGSNAAVLFREYGDTLSATVACEWRSGWFDFDQPMVEKYISLMEILHRGTIAVTINRDYKNEEQGGEDSEVVAAALTTGITKLVVSTVYLDNYGFVFQIVVTSTVAGETKQLLASGLASEAGITRFQSSIARVTLRARALTMMRR